MPLTEMGIVIAGRRSNRPSSAAVARGGVLLDRNKATARLFFGRVGSAVNIAPAAFLQLDHPADAEGNQAGAWNKLDRMPFLLLGDLAR